MECIERLIEAGFSLENAKTICSCYIARSDIDGLESFICSCEQYDLSKEKEGASNGI